MITQQDMFRIIMEKHNLTRDAFCAEYSVTRRSLDAWLLPSTSKGFRVAPNELMLRLENILIGGMGYFPNHIQTPIGDGFDICLEVSGRRIHFPQVFLHETSPAPGDLNKLAELGLTESECVVYRGEPLHGPILDGWTGKASLARYPQKIESPQCLVCTHHRSEAEANGFLSAALTFERHLSPDIEGHDGAEYFDSFVRVNGELFSIMRFPAHPSYPHSLFVFCASTLAFDSLLDGWHTAFLTKVITESGEVLDQLPWEWDISNEIMPGIKNLKERHNKNTMQSLNPVERSVVKRLLTYRLLHKITCSERTTIVKTRITDIMSDKVEIGNLTFRTDRLSVNKKFGVMGFLGDDESEVRLLGEGPEEMLILCDEDGATMNVLGSPKLHSIFHDEFLYLGSTFSPDGGRTEAGWLIAPITEFPG